MQSGINDSAEKDLTILLTLKGRHPFTFRWLAYANQINLPFRVLIADGGGDESLANTLSEQAPMFSFPCQYIAYPYDQTCFDYYDKMVDALSRVNTPFVALADNDDFPVVSSLKLSTAFLQAHADYSACRGRIEVCRVLPSDTLGSRSGIYGALEWVPEDYDHHSLEEETARGRLQKHFLKYATTWYDVHRTAQLRDAFRLLRNLRISDLYLAELVISGITVASGKVARAPDLFLLRQMNAPNAEAAKTKDVLDRMLLETWSSDFGKFVDTLAQCLAAQDEMSLDEARAQIKQLYRAYVGPFIVAWWGRNTESPRPAEEEQRSSGTTGRGLRKLHKLASELTNARRRNMSPVDNSLPDSEVFRAIKEFVASPPDDVRFAKAKAKG